MNTLTETTVVMEQDSLVNCYTFAHNRLQCDVIFTETSQMALVTEAYTWYRYIPTCAKDRGFLVQLFQTPADSKLS